MKINCQAFLEIKRIITIESLNTLVNAYEYDDNDKEIKGSILVKATCFIDDLDHKTEIEDSVPFNIYIVKENFNKDNINLSIDNLLYHPVEGRGIELEFDISIEEKETTSEEIDDFIEIPIVSDDEEIDSKPCDDIINEEQQLPLVEQRNLEKEYDENNLSDEEIIKDQVVQEVEEKLQAKLEQVDDNFPVKENDFLNRIERTYKRIKITFKKAKSELVKDNEQNNFKKNK